MVKNWVRSWYSPVISSLWYCMADIFPILKDLQSSAWSAFTALRAFNHNSNELHRNTFRNMQELHPKSIEHKFNFLDFNGVWIRLSGNLMELLLIFCAVTICSSSLWPHFSNLKLKRFQCGKSVLHYPALRGGSLICNRNEYENCLLQNISRHNLLQ